MSTKICVRCNIEKDISEYYKAAKNKDGHRNDCKDCVKEYNMEYAKNNKDKVRMWKSTPRAKEQKRKWNKNNKEKIKTYLQKYRETHREQERARLKRWYDKHRDEIIEKKRKERRENPEQHRKAARKSYYKRRHKILEYQREQYYKDPEKNKAKAKQWHKENPEAVQEISRNWMTYHYNNDANYKLCHDIRVATSRAVRMYLKDGRYITSKKADLPAIVKKLFAELPDDFETVGYGHQKYTVHHVIHLRCLDLTDPIQYKIAVDPRNVRWEKWDDNIKIGREWNDNVQSLYSELYMEYAETIKEF